MRHAATERLEDVALERYADDCAATGHAMCQDLGTAATGVDGLPPCEEMRYARRQVRLDEQAWSRFDVRYELMKCVDRFPDDTWSVPALMRLVHDSFMQGPLVPNLQRRGVWVTSALARLAEVGFPPDMIVRTAMKDELQRRLTLAVVALALDCDASTAAKEVVTHPLLPWVDVLKSCENQQVDGERLSSASASEVAARALRGRFAGVFSTWLRDTAIEGLLAWNLTGLPHGPLGDDDLALPGGDIAGQWVYDRNVHTSLQEWRRSSLDWELRYSSAPEVAAQDAGVSRVVLSQRPSLIGPVVAEIVRRTRAPGASDAIVAGLTRQELLEQVVLLIGDGQPSMPVTLLKEAVRKYPQDLPLRNALGFCLIPTDPAAALEQFSRCTPSSTLSPQLLAVNRAAALTRLGRHLEASEAAGAALTDEEGSVLLWPCETLLESRSPGSAALELTTPGRWAAQLRQRLAAA